MIGTSLNMTGPPGMIGASLNKNWKRSGMKSTSLIKNGLLGKIGASTNKTQKKS